MAHCGWNIHNTSSSVKGNTELILLSLIHHLLMSKVDKSVSEEQPDHKTMKLEMQTDFYDQQ